MTTSERYALLRDHPRALQRAVPVFETSGYFSEVLAQHPEIVAEFAEENGPWPRQGDTERSLFDALVLQPEKTLAGASPQQDAVFHYVISAELSYREKMDLLRQRFRQKFFDSATRDVIQPRPVYDSLAHTTLLTDRAIAAAVEIAAAPDDFVVLALGRLGTWEFDWASDADLLFVRGDHCDARTAIAATQQIVEVLSAYTRFGNLFAVDARLRPHGGEGELVNTPIGLQSYFTEEAQPWEALTFTKLRYVAGSQAIGKMACEAVKRGLRRFAIDESFTKAVREMRLRLQTSAASPANFKTSAGGFYDIDFILSVLQVRHDLLPAAMNTRAQIRDLAAKSLLSREDAQLLDEAAELLRACDHALRLITGRSKKRLPDNEGARAAATQLTQSILRRNFSGDLQGELQQSAEKVRMVYDRVLEG